MEPRAQLAQKALPLAPSRLLGFLVPLALLELLELLVLPVLLGLLPGLPVSPVHSEKPVLLLEPRRRPAVFRWKHCQ